jgi:hypothetical protein
MRTALAHGVSQRSGTLSCIVTPPYKGRASPVHTLPAFTPLSSCCVIAARRCPACFASWCYINSSNSTSRCLHTGATRVSLRLRCAGCLRAEVTVTHDARDDADTAGDACRTRSHRLRQLGVARPRLRVATGGGRPSLWHDIGHSACPALLVSRRKCTASSQAQISCRKCFAYSASTHYNLVLSNNKYLVGAGLGSRLSERLASAATRIACRPDRAQLLPRREDYCNRVLPFTAATSHNVLRPLWACKALAQAR